MVSTGTLTKIALALSALSLGDSGASARFYRENHPLLESDPEVDAVELPNGAISKRLYRSVSPRPLSHSELI